MKSYMIIGAGILGASAAYHLAKAGADVTVIDRKHPGQATDAAAGIVCPWLSQRRNQAWYAIAKGGARYYERLIQQLEADGETETGYQKVGAVTLHTDEKKLSQMEERAFKRREDAPEIGDITRLTPEETKALFPALSEEYGAVHVSGAARVNGRALRKALLNAAVKYGAAVYNEEASILTEDGAVIGVKTAERTLTAGQVLVTAGAWARELLEPLGIRFSVSYQKAQIIHLELQGEDTGGWPVVMPPNDQYILAFDSGRIIAGATHENDTGMDLRVTAGGLREIFDKALTVAPGLSDSTVIETRVGFRPFTPGFLPVIGKVPNISGLLVANGLGASGLTSGPYLGAELAKLALGQQTEIDLSLYDPAGALE
ncbi:NAD(P)/FAD-dependent oxidoreductase [Bacillus velezensis]|uniref:NAD(P)/FAD-dependent oxidoreductase n=1 Tax=Bacillus velezensis TaxID=492670 RepID=UPI000C9EC8E5|nr:FAD-binding oxidoreductase [Bacillus velezensis]AUS17202.1 FAD-dependent oxidoreductase [Bacillus velezensis]WED86905.1 FAD-binding oxidoreductase [Bacillus velezensis]WFB54916.1 FAD-binding oxidoreductase [Bacillus velezensis]